MEQVQTALFWQEPNIPSEGLDKKKTSPLTEKTWAEPGSGWAAICLIQLGSEREKHSSIRKGLQTCFNCNNVVESQLVGGSGK